MTKLLLVAAALASAGSARELSLLEELASQLALSRESPVISPIGCPSGLDSLAGLSLDSVRSKLGQADLEETGTDENLEATDVHQYLFARSDATWIGLSVAAGGYTAVVPLGEPFTVVQFHYSKGHVNRAQCYAG